MKLSENGVSFLREHEGIKLEPYRDIAGKWTIGIGHLIKPGERFTRITVDQAYAILREDVTHAEAAIVRHVRVPLTQNQFDSLVSWVFNLGEGNLRTSTLLKVLNQGKHHLVTSEMRKWVYARSPLTGKPVASKGLIRRREAEAALFSTRQG